MEGVACNAQIPIFCRHYTLPAEQWWTWGPDLEPYFARTFKGAHCFQLLRMHAECAV
jgi:hypothetical protein